MQNLPMTLASLRDLEGIVGSFVVSDDGDIVAKDLPSYFDGVLEEVGPRMLRLRDALDLAEGDVSSCTVRYAGHKLTIRSMAGALIAVIADAKTNGPALRMAMNLVIRKCGSEDLVASRRSFMPGELNFPKSATATPNSADSTRSDTFEVPGRAPLRSGAGAPEGAHGPQKKKRELIFRGKRVS